MTRIAMWSLAALLLMIVGVARADEGAPEVPEMTMSWHFGATVALAIPGGQPLLGYAFMGPAGFVALKGPVAFIWEVDLEVAPVFGNWGVVGAAALDIAFATWLSLDVGPVVVFDWDPMLLATRGQAETVYGGLYVGPTFIFPNGMSVGIGVTALCNFEGMGCSASPMLNIGVPFPPK